MALIEQSQLSSITSQTTGIQDGVHGLRRMKQYLKLPAEHVFSSASQQIKVGLKGTPPCCESELL